MARNSRREGTPKNFKVAKDWLRANEIWCSSFIPCSEYFFLGFLCFFYFWIFFRIIFDQNFESQWYDWFKEERVFSIHLDCSWELKRALSDALSDTLQHSRALIHDMTEKMRATVTCQSEFLATWWNAPFLFCSCKMRRIRIWLFFSHWCRPFLIIRKYRQNRIKIIATHQCCSWKEIMYTNLVHTSTWLLCRFHVLTNMHMHIYIHPHWIV